MVFADFLFLLYIKILTFSYEEMLGPIKLVKIVKFFFTLET